MAKMIGKISDAEKIEIAGIVCDQLGIDSTDSNIWQMIDCIDFDAIRNEAWDTEV